MSLLLKALKQAETAHAEKNTPPETDLALESLEPDPAKAREWLEPPGMLFGNSGLTPAPAKANRLRMPQLSLVPATALLAAIVAVGYGVYLYFELKPPANVAVPPPSASTSHFPEPTAVSPTQVPLPPLVATAPVVTVAPAPPAPLPEVTIATQASPKSAASALTSAPREQVAPSRAARNEPEARQTMPPYSLQTNISNNVLNSAYDAYQRGQLDEAQRLYTQAAARERSVDALLGLAAIAGIRNRDDEAARLYREVLERDPYNASAQAALLDMLGNTDRQATESRLKSLIDRAPSAGLYQTLGNLYAEQNRWSDAQTAYYEAFRIAPSNADYAFNLAVSLDRLQQAQAALGYYEKALALGGHPRFDRAQAELRIRQIKAAQP
mgnify:CR=1 FL=1